MSMLYKRNALHILTALGLLCLSPMTWAGDDDGWWEFDREEQALAVSEGALEFLATPPAQPVHRHENHITIRRESLTSGWVELSQCHYHLDAVARAEVVFAEGRTRQLRLRSSQQIGRVWVEGVSVQLEDVQKGATLCLEGESRALTALGDGRYRLRNGPYMRRFLDGYYPMQVRMAVELGTAGLTLESVSPPAQPGFRPRVSDHTLHIDTHFSGRLTTEIILRSP